MRSTWNREKFEDTLDNIQVSHIQTSTVQGGGFSVHFNDNDSHVLIDTDPYLCFDQSGNYSGSSGQFPRWAVGLCSLSAITALRNEGYIVPQEER